MKDNREIVLIKWLDAQSLDLVPSLNTAEQLKEMYSPVHAQIVGFFVGETKDKKCLIIAKEF